MSLSFNQPLDGWPNDMVTTVSIKHFVSQMRHTNEWRQNGCRQNGFRPKDLEPFEAFSLGSFLFG
jgi:hypothetical protein